MRKIFITCLFSLGCLMSFAGLAFMPPKPMPIAPAYAMVRTPARQLAALLSRIHTMQADFSETTYVSRSGSPAATKKQYGHMYLQRPGKFRWEITGPKARQTIVTNGKKLWYYDVDLNQVTRKNFDSSVKGSPAMLLSGNIQELTQDFMVGKIPSFSSNAAFSLTPKDDNSGYSNVQLFFIDDQLREMHIVDNLGQKTVIVFTNLLVNHNIYTATFNFIPPAGSDVVDG